MRKANNIRGRCCIYISLVYATIDYYPLVRQSVDDDVDAEACVVFGGEAFVFPVVVPFAAVVFVGIKNGDALIYVYSAQIVVNDVVAPAVEFVGSHGRAVGEFEERVVKRMLRGKLAHCFGRLIEHGFDFALEGFGEGSV